MHNNSKRLAVATLITAIVLLAHQHGALAALTASCLCNDGFSEKVYSCDDVLIDGDDVAHQTCLDVCSVNGHRGVASCSQPTCFPAVARVELQSGEFVEMKDLKVGQSVRVSESNFSPVFAFTHRDSDVRASFLRIATAERSITLTKGHLIMVNNNVLAPAENVRIGDLLTLSDGRQSAVISITPTRATGLYNPQTIEGTIVVVRVSNFNSMLPTRLSLG
jgi:hypothetical protein